MHESILQTKYQRYTSAVFSGLQAQRVLPRYVALDNELDAQKKEIHAADPACRCSRDCTVVPGRLRHLDVEFLRICSSHFYTSTLFIINVFFLVC